MFRIGRVHSKTCGGWTRRALLQAGTVGALGLSLPDLLRAEAASQRPGPPARSVILVWLWGGPSHLDTFDLKPAAPVQYRGPYTPIATSVPGIEICELLPRLARLADRYTLLRSLCHGSNDHGVAGTIGLTGSDAGGRSLGGQRIAGRLQPTQGAVVSRLLPRDERSLRFVTIGDPLHQGKQKIEGEGGGLVGPYYDPFRVNVTADLGVKVPQLELIDGQTPDGLGSRRDLLAMLDRISRTADQSPAFARMDSFYHQAFSLLTSPEARGVFDLERESDAVRRRYGRFRFGQCCLLARRLVESGVRFVQVNWSAHVEPVEDTGDGGWDMHDRFFQQYQDRHSWMLDQSLSALLEDLAGRGLLDETLVVAMGEFGRTPKINEKAGRDHWNQCYSALVAGGGWRGGQVIGASDPRAEFPSERPMSPADLQMSVFRQLGLGTTDLTAAGLTPLGEPIEELG